MSSRIQHMLPADDELVRRENVFLGLLNKYSIDEGNDAEMADFETDEKMSEDADCSVSEASEESEAEHGDDDDDDDASAHEITKQLEPVIRDRVNAWPKKGINLQLKRADPTISLDEWLKANQEYTTTTKKYKKTVVSEQNRTVTTTTKQTKTTTKRSNFNAAQFIPQLMPAMDDQRNGPTITEMDGEKTSAADAKSKSAKRKTGEQKKLKEQEAIKSTKLSDPTAIDKPMASKTRQGRQQKELKTKSNDAISLQDKVELLANNVHRMRLRAKAKENIVPTETMAGKSSSLKQMKKTIGKSKNDESPLYENQFDAPAESSNHSSRSPFQEKQLNQVDPLPQSLQVHIKLKRIQCPKVTTRNASKRLQGSLKESCEQTTPHEPNDATVPIDNLPSTAGNRLRSRLSTLTRPQEIVIYSPTVDTEFGTKIGDTLMLVTRNDYAKHIDPNALRRTNISERSIVPRERRIIYEPPLNDASSDSNDSDSECEDVLLSSYLNQGRVVHRNK